jgi:hypothetical protein
MNNNTLKGLLLAAALGASAAHVRAQTTRNPGTPIVTAKSATTTSAQLLGQNINRFAVCIDNPGAGVVYILAGTGTASAANKTLQVPATSTVCVPVNYVTTGPIQYVYSTGTATLTVMDTAP